MMRYFNRCIDSELLKWKESQVHLPLLVRGARQVGKSSTIRQFGKSFRYFAEVNLEKQPSLLGLFKGDIDVHKICTNLSATLSIPIIAGQTLLFIDEIQMSQQAIMSLRYFKEDYPELHVIAAGSLLEFALQDIPSFGVGRIRSLYLYPFSFDEFLSAQGLDKQILAKQNASSDNPLFDTLHQQLSDQIRAFYLVGGMPAAVSCWINTKDYAAVSRIHGDILDTYQDDFSKYKKHVKPNLLRQVLKSVALQVGSKFVYSQVSSEYHAVEVKEALRLLTLAGLIMPVTHSDGTGVPLGAVVDERYVKYLFMDQGLMLSLLGNAPGDILLANNVELVNRGGVAEMFVGLEIVKYSQMFNRPELYYWQHLSRNGNAEVDYLISKASNVLPIEVKANTRGSMQSLYFFMNKRHITLAVRIAMENFAMIKHVNKEDPNRIEQVSVIPLYAISNLIRI